MSSPQVEQHNITEGRLLCEALLKELVKHDPRTALIGLALALPHAANACRIRVQDTFELQRSFGNSLRSFEENLHRAQAVDGLLIK